MTELLNCVNRYVIWPKNLTTCSFNGFKLQYNIHLVFDQFYTVMQHEIRTTLSAEVLTAHDTKQLHFKKVELTELENSDNSRQVGTL